MIYVYSTLTCANKYNLYDTPVGGIATLKKSITIEGGHGVATKQLVTPQGAVTAITEEDLELLEKNPVFQTHKTNGFIRYTRIETKPEKVAKDMEEKDASAPKTPEDFAEDNVSPVVDKKKKK